MLVQCCVCGRVRHGAKWIRPDGKPRHQEKISHGYCPACAAKAFEEIREHHQVSPLTPKPAMSL